MYAICPICGLKLNKRYKGICSTLVGYISPLGHDHDDNCNTMCYMCDNGHKIGVSKINKCPVCVWVGKRECGCHTIKEKFPEWPDFDEELGE